MRDPFFLGWVHSVGPNKVLVLRLFSIKIYDTKNLDTIGLKMVFKKLNLVVGNTSSFGKFVSDFGWR